MDNILDGLDLIEDEADWESDDYIAITQEEEAFSKEIFEFVQSLIECIPPLSEEFTSYKQLNTHFNKHCLGLNPGDKKSRKDKVYYDFEYVNQYRNYEQEVNDLVINKSPRQQSFISLYDKEELSRSFRKLFEGNYSILFKSSCEFHNDRGPVAIGLNSFATKHTENYEDGNTINLIVLTPSYSTITMYPVAAHYLETKLDNIIKKYNNINTEIVINSNKSIPKKYL